ncbi:unnamed protein product [Ceutorhynchus assimilis]|uniref:Uncharacterized protein n=1 Tax=Ceutorhynchus assimilis TaxID=467358 RepID=A0A9P0DTZ0_9CUCU|nr:unnamed protein product [Ceutorhynchus assimilis]
MEEVMTDLSFLIDPSRIKKEVVEAPKPKKLTKRQRLELIKKDLTKKENLENTLNKLDAADAKLIDRLDLNVRKFKKILPKIKRRHSIEKIPITGDTVFTQLPRSLSPKTSKRTARLLNKPYTTRSDSPARMLRNGKHRRLKDFVLLEGLEGPKRRKRVHSDLSGSEIASKLSGYESDSSYSDMASLHDGNKDIDSLLMDESSNAPTQIDTNSNVCDSKMPEKNLLLDIMKQAFNDMGNDKLPVEKPCTSASTEEQELRQLLEQTEEKQAAEQIQECIDNITNLAKAASEEAPVLEKQIQDDSIPVIDNMSSEPPQNLEHLGPPFSESSVAMLEQKRSFVDENIGIAVVEKDNVVSFHIEHLSGDDVDEPETSNEDLNQSLDEKMEVETEEKVEEDLQTEEKVIETESKETEVEVEESVDEVEVKQQCNIKESVAEPECAVEESVAEAECAVEEAKCEVEVEEPKNECTSVVEEPKNDEATKQPEEAKTIVEQADKVDETGQEILSEKEDCDKTSENIDVKKPEETEAVKESPEQLAEKECFLGALGLQSLRAAKESPQPRKKGKATTSKAAADSYTGTLKTVIKINKKRGKNSFKMTLQKNKNKSEKVEAAGGTGEDGYKVLKEGGSSSSKHSKDSSDTAENSSEHTSDSEQANQDKSQPEKSLIVPEKASSFSIHPGRLCKDECSYCFGEFGLFDTPCHIAQIKSVDRQNKILATEQHLTRDSCLCDACYRHVDRKSNSPSYINKSLKRNSLVAPGPRQNHCHVLACSNTSTNILRRKWIIKMRKSICQVINIDLDNPGLHSIPICDEHYEALEHLMICGMCKRRLARNHIHYLGPEVKELNEALKDEGISIVLCNKPVVCKLCKGFASIILKDPEERAENSINFFKEYKKRLLHFNDIVQMDVGEADELLLPPAKSADKKDSEGRLKRMRNSSNDSGNSETQDDELEEDVEETRKRVRVPSSDTNHSQSADQSRAQSPEDEYAGVDYNTLIPAIVMDCSSDNESKKDRNSPKIIQRKTLESFGGSVEISRSYKKDNDLAAQKLGQNPSISLKPNYGDSSWQDEAAPSKLISNPALSVRQLFPGEEEMGLVGDIDFKNVVARTPEGWEKCVTTIQYDKDTKMLWEELQKPYGSKSSFLRHLVLLEKYFRSGDLVLSPSANNRAVNYKESVHNRLRAYDNIPSNVGQAQPPSMIQFTKINLRNTSNSNGLPPVTISQVGRPDNEIQTSRTPITLQQLNQPPLYPTSTILQNLAKNKAGAAPPGLISINQKVGASSTIVRPPVPCQKIKFPITKNWRPNFIPIDPAMRNERKPGLVQVGHDHLKDRAFPPMPPPLATALKESLPRSAQYQWPNT